MSSPASLPSSNEGRVDFLVPVTCPGHYTISLAFSSLWGESPDSAIPEDVTSSLVKRKHFLLSQNKFRIQVRVPVPLSVGQGQSEHALG